MNTTAQLCEEVQKVAFGGDLIHLQLNLGCRFKRTDNRDYYIPKNILQNIRDEKDRRRRIYEKSIDLLDKVEAIIKQNVKEVTP